MHLARLGPVEGAVARPALVRLLGAPVRVDRRVQTWVQVLPHALGLDVVLPDAELLAAPSRKRRNLWQLLSRFFPDGANASTLKLLNHG